MMNLQKTSANLTLWTLDEMVQDFANRLAQQGLDLETYLKFTQMDREQFKKTFAEQAQQQVKIRLALEAVVKAEGITASDEDLEAELLRISTTYNYPITELRKSVPADEVKKDLAIQKAIDFIKENAEIANA